MSICSICNVKFIHADMYILQWLQWRTIPDATVYHSRAVNNPEPRTNSYTRILLSRSDMHASLSYWVSPPTIIRVIESWSFQVQSADVILLTCALCSLVSIGLEAMMQLAQVGQSLRMTSVMAVCLKQADTQSTTCRSLESDKLICWPFSELLHVRQSYLQLTSLLGGLVVGLADQPAVLHQIVLVTCRKLPLAYNAGKAVQVVDEVLRPPHHLCGRNPLLTCCAFGPESPFGNRRLPSVYISSSKPKIEIK